MTRILALAAMAVRSAIRSRLLASLLLLLALVVVVLPLTVKGDGTLAGRMRVLLQYSLGLAVALMGLATLWTACGAISQEIEQRQIRLLAVKPVSKAEIWLGKWIGLLAMNAVLIGLAGAAIYTLVLWQTAPGRAPEVERRLVREQILTGRVKVDPQPEAVEAVSRSRLNEAWRKGWVPEGVSYEEALEAVKRQVRNERLVVPPGSAREWRFEVPRGRRRFSGAAFLRVRFASSFALDKKPVSGEWQVTIGDKSAVLPMADAADGVHGFTLPAGLLAAGGPVTVRFVNADRSRSNTAVFHQAEGARILIPAASFGSNLARTLAVLWCYLAFLAALGMTAGALFSFPVATFAAVAVLVMVLSGHFLAFASASAGAGDPHAPGGAAQRTSALNRTGEAIGLTVNRVSAPVLGLNPLGLLADGVVVSWGMTARAVGLLGLGYPLALWLAGTWLLSRRELALPTSQS